MISRIVAKYIYTLFKFTLNKSRDFSKIDRQLFKFQVVETKDMEITKPIDSKPLSISVWMRSIFFPNVSTNWGRMLSGLVFPLTAGNVILGSKKKLVSKSFMKWFQILLYRFSLHSVKLAKMRPSLKRHDPRGASNHRRIRRSSSTSTISAAAGSRGVS